MLRVLFSADKENAEPEQMQNTTLRKIKAMKSHSIHGFYIETAAKIRIFRSFRFRSCYFRRIIVTREILSSQPDTETLVVIFPSLAGVILMSMRHPLSACSLHKKTLQFGAQTAVVSGLRHLIPSWFPPSWGQPGIIHFSIIYSILVSVNWIAPILPAGPVSYRSPVINFLLQIYELYCY